MSINPIPNIDVVGSLLEDIVQASDLEQKFELGSPTFLGSDLIARLFHGTGEEGIITLSSWVDEVVWGTPTL